MQIKLTKQVALILIVSLFTVHAHATTSYWAINRITRQYTEYEDGGLYDPIGWTAAPEKTDPVKLVSMGYTYTSFPYLIECVIGGTIILAAITIILIKWKQKRCQLSASPEIN